MIYALEILGRKYVKIGYTRHGTVQQRIAELQTGSPYELTPIVWIGGTIRQEQAIHAALNTAFARCGIPVPPNEWYPGKHPIMGQFLDRLQISANQAIAFAERFNPSIKQPSPRGDGMARTLRKEWPAR